MFRTSRIMAAMAVVALIACTGCETEDRIVTVTMPVDDVDKVPLDPAIVGTWLLEEGTMVPDLDTDARVTAFDLDEDGLATVYFHDDDTGAKAAVLAYALYDGQTFALDFSREPALAGNPERTMFYPVVVIENDFLGMADETGQIVMLSRQAALPGDVILDQLPFTTLAAGLPALRFFTGLVLMDSGLIYNSDDGMIERFDLLDDVLDSPLGPTSGRYVQTSQGIDFWAHCACGGSPELVKQSLDSVVDRVHTGNDLGMGIVIRAAALETTTSNVWMHGFSYDYQSYRFLVVDADAEPDVLVRHFTFDRVLSDLAFDGVDMWGLITFLTPSIARIDVETGRVIETYEVPDAGANWMGLVVDLDGTIYVVGEDPAGDGIIVEAPGGVTAVDI